MLCFCFLIYVRAMCVGAGRAQKQLLGGSHLCIAPVPGDVMFSFGTKHTHEPQTYM